MFSHIAITNFKSVRQLEFDPKRVNLFIGEPNTGKSNLIESFAPLAQGTYSAFKQILRFRTTADLFYDQNISSELLVKTGDLNWKLEFKNTAFEANVWRTAGKRPDGDSSGPHVGGFFLSHSDLLSAQGFKSDVLYFRYVSLPRFQNQQAGALNPPFGDNLVAVLYANKELRQRVGAIFRSKGFRLEIRPVDSELLIAKEKGDELYSFPYESISETWRRIVFFMAVLETNQNSVLLLDEPEANTFPFYTKYLAERIALDETNQFFITTHNPYLLGSILAKAPADQVAVFVTYMENFETKLKPITGERLTEVVDLSSDVFFNLEKLLTA